MLAHIKGSLEYSELSYALRQVDPLDSAIFTRCVSPGIPLKGFGELRKRENYDIARGRHHPFKRIVSRDRDAECGIAVLRDRSQDDAVRQAVNFCRLVISAFDACRKRNRKRAPRG